MLGGRRSTSARQLVHRLWANEGLPGELAQILPTPEHFEQASELVTEEIATADVPCGSDVDEHLKAIRAYDDAGFDELYINQIGPDQDEFFGAYREYVLPRYSLSLRATAVFDGRRRAGRECSAPLQRWTAPTSARKTRMTTWESKPHVDCLPISFRYKRPRCFRLMLGVATSDGHQKQTPTRDSAKTSPGLPRIGRASRAPREGRRVRPRQASRRAV